MHPATILIILVICLAGFAQGLSGFGFGLVAMSLLPLCMGLKDAVPLVVLLNLVVCGTTFLAFRGHYSWRQGLSMVVGACVGIPIGTYALIHLDEVILRRLLGGVMLTFCINEIVLAHWRAIHLSPRLGFSFGVVSGSLSGAFNMGGPPAIAFSYSQTWGKEQTMAVLQVVFGVSTVLRLILLGNDGLLTKPLLWMGLWTVAPLVMATAVGHHFFSTIKQNTLKQAVFLFLGVMGIKYLMIPQS